jgi:hypothetical protein
MDNDPMQDKKCAPISNQVNANKPPVAPVQRAETVIADPTIPTVSTTPAAGGDRAPTANPLPSGQSQPIKHAPQPATFRPWRVTYIHYVVGGLLISGVLYGVASLRGRRTDRIEQEYEDKQDSGDESTQQTVVK